jgi:two-component system response regulator LytT
MKVVICDDEKAQLDLLHKYLEEYFLQRGISLEIADYQDCDTLWWDLQDGLDADLFLLDIQMEHLTGIELARKMRAAHMYQLICFITGIKDYVFEGYDVDALGYILKPFEKQQLEKILDKAAALLDQQPTSTLLHSGRDTFRIYHHDVIGLEAVGHDTKIYLKQSRTNDLSDILLKIGINECIDQLGMNLTLIHRSYAVNLKNILRIGKDECIGENNTHFPIARGRRDMVMQAFIQQNRGSL